MMLKCAVLPSKAAAANPVPIYHIVEGFPAARLILSRSGAGTKTLSRWRNELAWFDVMFSGLLFTGTWRLANVMQ
jgi:hypothetical protein